MDPLGVATEKVESNKRYDTVQFLSSKFWGVEAESLSIDSFFFGTQLAHTSGTASPGFFYWHKEVVDLRLEPFFFFAPVRTLESGLFNFFPETLGGGGRFK